MKQDRTCKYCVQLFENIDGKVFANHVRWCDKNTTNGDKGTSKIGRAVKLHHDSEKGTVTNFEVICNKCSTKFVVRERANLHPQRDVYFCTQSCANNRGQRSDVTRNKIRDSLFKTRPPREKQQFTCRYCHIAFKTHKLSQCFCTKKCGARYRYKDVDKSTLKSYRQQCNFKFALNDYPHEFDFTLVEKYGWYKAKNHGDNLTGVSRDHMVSIKFGYVNHVDPMIISHPANCRLLVHSSNISKGANCTITLEELLARIKVWDTKYTV